jgi:hypothetical protein
LHILHGTSANRTEDTRAAMNARERTASPGSRLEYRWDVDRNEGFEKSTFIYDAQGHLIAVDYGSPPAQRREPPPRVTPAR